MSLSHHDFYLLLPVITDRNIQCAPLGSKDIPLEERSSYFKGGEFCKNMPGVFVETRGRKRNDFMYGAVGLYLISDKLRAELEAENITGAEFIPVEIERRSGRRYGNYSAMIVNGRADGPDRELSVPKFIQTGALKMWRDVGYIFPLDSWDKSDIFYLEGTKFSIILTERAKNIFQKYPDGCFLDNCGESIWQGHSIKFDSPEACRDKNSIPR